jgi:hypothetical protein
MGLLRQAVRGARNLLKVPDRSREPTSESESDQLKVLMGTLLAESVARRPGYGSLAELEFKVFSQFGDDGIIQYLTRNLELRQRTFVEFGVEDYMESNTRFLLQKDNWSGFVMDGSSEHIERLRSAPFYWKHDLTAEAVFVTRENIRQLLRDNTRQWDGLDLLHIDLDGNDYWIWREIDLNPALVIMEYNSTFGLDRAITVPYSADFHRSRAHFSNLYWGSSLKALHSLALQKGYDFLGCNSAGNNAYFVRRDVMNDRVKSVSLEQGYVASKYRESRDREGKLSYLSGAGRAEAIRGLPVFDIEQNKLIPF